MTFEKIYFMKYDFSKSSIQISLIIEPFTQTSKSCMKNEEDDYRMLLLHKNVNLYKENR